MPDSPHVMKDVADLPEHAALTRKFIGTLVIAVIALVVALGLFAVRYGTTDASEKTVLLVVLVILFVVALIFGVIAVRFSRQIVRLTKG